MMPAMNKRPVRKGVLLNQVRDFLCLPFCPARVKTYLAVDRVEDIPVDQLLADGVEGILLDADGTLGTNKTRNFPDSVVRHVRHMRDRGLKVAIYTNSFDNRFQQFSGVSIATDVPFKPDRRGFEIAMKKYLHLDDPAKVCMVGDNYITDGGAINMGMRFIYVKPVKGNENYFHRFTRYFAYLCARLHSGKNFRYISS